MPSFRLKALLFGGIGLLTLVVVVLAVVFVTMRPGNRPAAPGSVTIEVSDTTCTPDKVEVAAGAPSFSIRNTSARAIEWEILNGVMVVAERENIAPGFVVELTPRLEPGTYQMTCGLLSNPRGTLTVVAANGSVTALPAAPKLADLVGPTAEYRVYAIQSANQLTAAAAALAASVQAADLAAARTHAADAVTAYAHLAPVLHLFGEGADALGSGPASLADLARSLAGATSTDGLAGAAEAVAHSATDLGGTVTTTTAGPREIIAGAGAVVADLGQHLADPAEARARLAGIRKVVELFRPLTLRADKSLAAKLDTDLGAVQSALEASPAPSSPPPQLADLNADLTDLLSALGLNAS